jgi:hypothetical protein
VSDRYDSVEFDTFKYMASSGGLSCPDSDSRITYYGISGLPTLVWQGTIYNVGAGTDVINGDPYDAIIRSLLPAATPFVLRITDFNYGHTDPFVTVQVELEDDVADISNTYIRVFIVENDLQYSSTIYQDILRDMLPQTALTIDTAGQVQEFTQPLPIQPSWVTENLRLVAIVQRDTDKAILQACNSLPVGDYAFRFYSLGDRVVVASGAHQFDDFALFNQGNLDDTYHLSLDTSDLPVGWNAWLTDGVDSFDAVEVSLQSGERTIYNVVVETGSPGGGGVTLNIHSLGNRTDDRQVSYSVITADTEILLVDDDGPASFESDYFAPAIEAAGRSYAIWDRGSAAVSGLILENFDTVVWNVGWAFPSLDADDRAALSVYLDGGGRLFVSGQDIGWDLNDQGGTAYQWYRQYLHANYINDDTNDYTLDGVADDPVSDGISLIITGGDGANNQEYPSDIDPYGEGAGVIFTYDLNRNGAIKADTGVYKVVYFAFGYEAINNATDRNLVMERVLNWLTPTPSGLHDGSPTAPLVLYQNVPNPFNPVTEIFYRLGQEGEVRLEIFDVAGRLVRVLEDGVRPAGEYRTVWDGHDAAGHQLSSGTYFYRLHTEGVTATRKMLMLK